MNVWNATRRSGPTGWPNEITVGNDEWSYDETGSVTLL